jgi:hypothetical protein
MSSKQKLLKERKTLLDALKNEMTNRCASIKGPFVVSKAQQLETINSLRDTIKSERFFFVVDMQKAEIKHCYGVGQWLGYHDYISFDDYWYMRHPSTDKIEYQYFKGIVEQTSGGHLDLSFMREKFVAIHPLRHADGSYVVVKRMTSGFQYNKSKQVTEYINEFTILKEYDHELFSARGIDSFGNRMEEWMGRVQEHVKKESHQILPFSPKELLLLRLYAFTEIPITNEVAGIKLSTSKGVVETLNKRIIHKAKDLFEHPFITAQEVGRFLTETGLF